MPRGFRVRPAGAAVPAAQHAPWQRSARTAKAGCLPRFAKSGPVVLAASLVVSLGGDNPLPACLFRLYPRKNPGRCDLLHISLVGPGLDRRHEQRDPNLIRRAGRPPHRLRPDRHRRRSGPGCAGLPPAGLNPRRKRPARHVARSWVRLHANPLGSRHPDFSVVRSRPLPAVGRVPQKSVKRGACCSC